MDKAWNVRDKLNEICVKSGFSFVSIDLKGYRTGSMNEVLTDIVKTSFNVDTKFPVGKQS
jgi:PP-loop superfamily ATP-utilizing enzyme